MQHHLVSHFSAGEGDDGGVEDIAKKEEAAQAVADKALDALLPPTPFDELKLSYGASKEKFEEFQTAFGAHFAPSASAGLALSNQNDHAGILVVPARDGDKRVIAERLTVVCEKVRVPKNAETATAQGKKPMSGERDTSASETEMQTRYFVKGDGDRIVPFSELERLASQLTPFKTDNGKAGSSAVASGSTPNMGTAFRTGMRALSEASELWARRNAREAESALLPSLPNPTPYSPKEGWANNENNMPKGAGPKDENGFYPIYLNYDSMEKRLVIFKREDKEGKAPARGRHADDTPSSLPLSGPMIAQITGIAHMEVISPAGEHPGVKNARPKMAGNKVMEVVKSVKGKQGDLERQQASRKDTVLVITTEIGKRIQLVVGDGGISMSLLDERPDNPATGPAVGLGPEIKMADEDDDCTQVNVFTFKGSDPGPLGTRDGFAEPKISTSMNDDLPAETFLHKPDNFAQGAGRMVLRAVTATPNLGENRSMLAVAINTLIRTLIKAAYVAAFNHALQAIQEKKSHHTILGGTNRFSGSGEGSIDTGKMFEVVLCTLLLQEALTNIFALIGRVVPEHVKRPESIGGELTITGGTGAVQEFIRQLINYGLQKAFDLPRGEGKDVGMLFTHSVISGGIDFFQSRSGYPENHPNATLFFEVAKYASDLFARSCGNMLSHKNYNPETATVDFQEAVLSRFITRGPDRLILPVAVNLLDRFGIIGNSASAYSHGLSREARYNGVIHAIKTFSDDIAVRAWHMEASFAEVSMVRKTLHAITDWLEALKQGGNRIGLRPNLKVDDEIAMVTRANSFPQLSADEQAEYFNSLEDQFLVEQLSAKELLDAILNVGKAPPHPRIEELPEDAVDESTGSVVPPDSSNIVTIAQSGKRAPTTDSNIVTLAQSGKRATTKSSIGAVTTSSEELPPTFKRTMTDLDQRLKENTYRTEVSLDNKRWPAGARPGWLHGSPKIPREATTWSREAQRRALETHRKMAMVDGIESFKRNAAGILPEEVIKLCLAYIKDYTKESGYFHYPLRWDITGEIQLKKIAKGIYVPYHVMIKPGNTDGPAASERTQGDEYFDPIGALYINLAMHYADKSPSLAQRAVVTEASYVTSPPKDRLRSIMEGDTVGTSEILSMTHSSSLGAAFGQAIGYGAAPRENSLRLRIFHKTGVNVTKRTDLAQAELIMPPGVLFLIRTIDPNAGKEAPKPGEKAVRDIAQVVYQEQRDTYELEKPFNAYLRREDVSHLEDGAEMVHPKTGFLHTWDAAAGKPVDKREEVRNYFLGPSYDWKGDEEVARWKEPFTSDTTPRTTKDAIHVAILERKPIVTHLDQATENYHHASFRGLGGYADSPAKKEADESRQTLREHARQVAALLPADVKDELGGIGAVAPDGKGKGRSNADYPGEMLAWIATSFLRQPIQFIDLAGEGREEKLISRTYDRETLDKEVPVTVGVGKDGFYSISSTEDGKLRASKISAEGTDGFTAANLLHAICHNSPNCDLNYREGADRQLRPDRDAQESVRDLLREMRSFVATDYALLQEKLVDKASELGWTPAASA